MRPFAGSLHTLFQRPDGFQIFLHFALILMAEAVLEAAALVHQQIQNAGLPLEPGTHLLDAFAGVGFEQPVENLLRLVHRGNRPAGPAMGQRLAPSVGTGAALGAQHHGGESGLMPVRIGGDLINGNAVGFLSAHHVRARGEHVTRAVPAQGPAAGVIQSAVVAHVLLQRLEGCGRFIEGQRTGIAARPPAPFVVRLLGIRNTMLAVRHVGAVGKIAHQHPFRMRLAWSRQTHAVKERQGQGNAASLKQFAPIQVPAFRFHGLLPFHSFE